MLCLVLCSSINTPFKHLLPQLQKSKIEHCLNSQLSWPRVLFTRVFSDRIQMNSYRITWYSCRIISFRKLYKRRKMIDICSHLSHDAPLALAATTSALVSTPRYRIAVCPRSLNAAPPNLFLVMPASSAASASLVAAVVVVVAHASPSRCSATGEQVALRLPHVSVNASHPPSFSYFASRLNLGHCEFSSNGSNGTK